MELIHSSIVQPMTMACAELLALACAESALARTKADAYPNRPVRELIALTRAKPVTLNFGAAGMASSLHMTEELFKHVTNINIVHAAYKGTAPALTDLLAGARSGRQYTRAVRQTDPRRDRQMDEAGESCQHPCGRNNHSLKENSQCVTP